MHHSPSRTIVSPAIIAVGPETANCGWPSGSEALRIGRPKREVARASKRGSDAMPEVYVYAVEGRTIDQKRKLVKDITEAVVKNFNVKPEAVMVQIMESSRESKAKGGFLFSDRPPG
jgi:4-oxalocrotonate tautomerase